MLPIVIVATVASLCTGAATYFAVRPSGSSSSGNTNTSAGIQNNVNLAMEEKHDFANTLLLTLVCLRLFELFIFAFNSYRKTLKKKYGKRPTTQQQPATPAQP